MRNFMICASLACLFGCAPELVPGRYGCETDSECPDGWGCGSDDRCYPNGQAPDASQPAASPDAGTDAGSDGGTDAGSDAEVPCEPGPTNVDLLLMVDQSYSMQEAQSLLKTSLGRFVDLLISRDVDDDGRADFPVVDSLHVGVITSDMGAYTESGVFTCDASGDDGVLLTTHFGSDSACGTSSFDAIQTYEPGDSRAAFVERVGCLADVGPSGCGFEQQLDAVLKALMPRDPDFTFYDGSFGHGADANAGFLRDDSVLITLLVSDENDCSTHNAALFTDRTMFPLNGRSLNHLCAIHSDALLPTSRFSEGLLGLREDPSDLIFGVIGGVPLDAPLRTPADLLNDPVMTITYPTMDDERPSPACAVSGSGGVSRQGDPGRRYVEVAQEIEAGGGAVAIRSICEPDFDGMSLDLLARLAPRLRARSCELEPAE